MHVAIWQFLPCGIRGGMRGVCEEQSLCQLQSTAVGRLRTGREAAGLRSLLPASICKELVQSWRRASSTKLRLEEELQESGSERTLRRNGDEATPAENPCCLGGVADSGRGTGCARPGEEANKGGGGGFLSPASSKLETKHDQATAAAAVDLGVRLPAFASRGIADGPTRVVVGSVMRAAIAGHRADERGVSLCNSSAVHSTATMLANVLEASAFFYRGATTATLGSTSSIRAINELHHTDTVRNSGQAKASC
ncbi:hypothetical protein AK812_SmicGene28434 [Symbiodinium microadriaticum]|uniref:Uncharacterized protein n=1 Tax=Symbiodinium microadriaticum TaxID=2951 RepID=A0A1Q9D4D3_SYMMI|nr:hypothetical protein AK812_SmicGene28434 [Symbiodinium microadriaticum]